MKTPTILPLLTAACLVLAGLPLTAHEKIEAGPRGGRMLSNSQPPAEFLVTADRKVEIRFVGADGKVVPPAEQVVTVTTGERSAPVTLTFTKTGDTLVSDRALPDGDMLPAVVQIRPRPGAKAAVSKFTVNLAVCPGCQRAEYACTCDH